jgi:excisionase family DNA binding protein
VTGTTLGGGADPDRYLSRGQAARYLGVPALKLYEWARQGRLRHRLTLGGHLRFRVGDLDALSGGGTSISEGSDETTTEVDGVSAARVAGQSGDDYLTAGEAARCLHVSPKTVNRWANGGLIRCIVTLGGHRRFRREDVEAAAREMSESGSGQA